MSEDFTLEAYRGLLATLLEHGYTACGYANAAPERRDLILRHDIDMSLDSAVQVAEVEHELGVRAHYFVLVRTEMYNLFSARAQGLLRRLTSLGHEIGLHLDAAFYENDPAALDQAAAQECAIVETATGHSVRAMSLHRPTDCLLGYDGPLGGRVHAYQPRFFREMGYCSDSRGGWHHGHPLEHAAVREGRGLQLLTHPIWWTTCGDGPVGKLKAFLSRKMEALDEEMAKNSQVYSREIGE